jgi:hypothetical protein
VASAAICWHLTAIVIAPWRLSTPDPLPPNYVPQDEAGRLRPDLPPPPPGHPDRPEAALIGPLYRFMTPYLNLAFVNHGYEFFAPNPSATKLIRYEAFNDRNQVIATDTFPDRKSQWPRLFYHRHMMLAEQAGELGPDALRIYGAHLLKKHQAARVRVDYGVHYLLSPVQALAGRKLNDSELYETLDSVEVTAASEPLPPRLEAETRIPGVSP